MRKKKDLIAGEDNEEIIDAEEEGLIAERWSSTKIIIGSVLILFFLGAAIYGFLYYKRFQESQGNNILGIAESKKREELPTNEDVEETIENVQEELNKVNPNNLFSSQDSIQKMINDLESLRQSTQDPKAAFCSAVCGPQQTVVVKEEKTSSPSATQEE